jgi:hypothetical protein
MKKCRIGMDALTQRSLASCAKSQTTRLIRVCAGTPHCRVGKELSCHQHAEEMCAQRGVRTLAIRGWRY